MEPTSEDLRELKKILSHGTTPYVEKLLKEEINRIEVKISQQSQPEPAPTPEQKPKESFSTIKFQAIESYAFSNEDNEAKIIIRNIENLTESKIVFDPQAHSFAIAVMRNDLPNLKLTVGPLFKKIIPKESKYIAQNKTLTVILKKSKKQTWTKLKKSPLDKKKDKKDENEKKVEKEDPNASIMNLMKKMYDEGDDEMKRTISKAMWEAQHKKSDEKDNKN
jgi:calcyclin binding protein